MTFDEHCVRIDLHDVMSVSFENGSAAMKPHQGADIWLAAEPGKISRARKPHISLVDDTRAGVLRQIADWLEHNDDPGLARMAVEITGTKAAARERA
jgi:hypothetical protein